MTNYFPELDSEFLSPAARTASLQAISPVKRWTTLPRGSRTSARVPFGIAQAVKSPVGTTPVSCIMVVFVVLAFFQFGVVLRNSRGSWPSGRSFARASSRRVTAIIRSSPSLNGRKSCAFGRFRKLIPCPYGLT